MKIKGCILVFGEQVGKYCIGEDCEFVIPKIIPIVYRPRELGHFRIVGSCNVMKTNSKLFLKNAFIFEDKLSEGIIKDMLHDGGLTLRYYAMESHENNASKILDRARIVEVNIIPTLISNEHRYEIVNS